MKKWFFSNIKSYLFHETHSTGKYTRFYFILYKFLIRQYRRPSQEKIRLNEWIIEWVDKDKKSETQFNKIESIIHQILLLSHTPNLTPSPPFVYITLNAYRMLRSFMWCSCCVLNPHSQKSIRLKGIKIYLQGKISTKYKNDNRLFMVFSCTQIGFFKEKVLNAKNKTLSNEKTMSHLIFERSSPIETKVSNNEILSDIDVRASVCAIN